MNNSLGQKTRLELSAFHKLLRGLLLLVFALLGMVDKTHSPSLPECPHKAGKPLLSQNHSINFISLNSCYFLPGQVLPWT